MSCLDNTDILRIVGGNSFQIAITVKARRVSDGSEIEDFDLSASSPVLNLIHAGEKTRKYFVTQGNQAIISFSGSEGLGYYGMEMSGSYNSEAWRFCIEKVLQLVDTNAKANIPEWSFLVDDTYFIEGTISIYGGGGGGDTVQADWTETNPTSAAFILHKPDLSVYATKAEVASGLAGKQDTIVDLTSIRYGAAAGATAYQKPSSGIPESDMSEGVQSALDKADSAYQKPSSGIPATDMSEGVQASLEKANSAVQTETDPVFSGSPAAEITQADINNWNAKQSAIADLADIREGAAAGATAVQPDEMAQAIDGVEGDIDAINAKIPTAASNLNQLADKAYVNSSIATNSATYRGSFNLITDLGMNVDATHAQIAGALATTIVTADNNDYAFVQIPDSASTPTVIAKIERYKHNGTGWVYEYDLNNSGFTAAQWAAINSGITSGLVGKLADLPNNSELATLLNGKQNVINDLATIRSGAAAGATAYQKPSGGIPASDMSSTVQQDLSKANTAVQTETDPIFSASPAAGITAQNIQTWNGEPAARQAADTALQTAIQDEATARATADALLQQQYNALTQSDIIVGALPVTGVSNVIYRVPGTTDFTDYMWYNNQFVAMATYGLPISAEFVVDNNLNKTQEEINGEVDAQINGGSEEQDLSEELTLINNRGYVNYETGEVVTYNGYVVYGADVAGLPSIRISCSGPNSTTNKQGLAFYDVNGTYIDGEIYAISSQEIREVDVPNGAAYVKVSISNTYTDPIKFYGMIASKGIVDDINDIKEELEALPETFGSTDAITDPNSEKTQTTINTEVDEVLNGGSGWIDESSSVEWTLGKNINGRYETYGYGWGTNADQKASDYIAVSPGDQIIITIPAVTKATYWWGIGYYDASKVAVDCGVTRYVEGYETANTPREITIPEGVYYIRTTSWIDETTYGAFVYKKLGHIDGLIQRVAALEEGGDSAAKKYAGLKCVAIGDSHSNTNARSIWLGRITEKTGMVYLAELNSIIYFANTTPPAYEMCVNALLAQAQALVDNAPNYDEPDVIFVEEVHQRWDDTIGAKPFIPHNLIDLGYTKNNRREEYEYFEANATSILGAIASVNRHEGSVLRSSVSTSQIVATFSASSVSAGNITITIGGVAHVISVTSGMTVKQVVDTVYIQAFGDDSDWSNTSKTDTTITFSWIGAGEATNNFVIDTGNTGVTITMGSISTTTVYVYRRYNQYDLTDWTDKTKWDSFGAWNLNQQNSNGTYGYWTNAYAAMGGVITLLQTHFPNAMIVWMALPNWGGPAAFNPAPKNAAELKTSYAWTYDKASRDKFIEIGELYNLRTIDVECVSEISVANYSTFFTQGNVHPKEDGYKRWGDVIANWI